MFEFVTEQIKSYNNKPKQINQFTIGINGKNSLSTKQNTDDLTFFYRKAQ